MIVKDNQVSSPAIAARKVWLADAEERIVCHQNTLLPDSGSITIPQK
jgi:hypothetical protein